MRKRTTLICVFIGTTTALLCLFPRAPRYVVADVNARLSNKALEQIRSLAQETVRSKKSYIDVCNAITTLVPSIDTVDLFFCGDGSRHIDCSTHEPIALLAPKDGAKRFVLYADGAVTADDVINPLLFPKNRSAITLLSPELILPAKEQERITHESAPHEHAPHEHATQERAQLAAWLAALPAQIVESYTIAWENKTNLVLMPRLNQPGPEQRPQLEQNDPVRGTPVQAQLWCLPTTSVEQVLQAQKIVDARPPVLAKKQRKKDAHPLVIDLRIPHLVIVKNKPKGWVTL